MDSRSIDESAFETSSFQGVQLENNDYTDEIVDTTFDGEESEDDKGGNDSFDNNDFEVGSITNMIDSNISVDTITNTSKENSADLDHEGKLTHKISRRKLVDIKQDSKTSNTQDIDDQSISSNSSLEDSSFDEEQDDEESDAEEYEEGEDEPPKLKYTRMSQLPARFFKKDPVSTCFFNNGLFFFGSHSGFLHICKEDFTTIRTLKAHRSSILSIHSDGEYFASGSIDGTVVIGSIINESDIIAYDFKRSIHAVALDKKYSTTKGFFSGGANGDVTYTSKGWLGQRQDSTFDSNNGPITMIKVIDNLVIWTNNEGIKIGHISSATMIHQELIPKDSPPPEMYWPRLFQSSPDKFVIGWANNIWIFKITSIDHDSTSNSHQFANILSSASSTFKGLPEKKVVLENHMQLEDNLIAGISEIGDDFMILNFIPPVRKANGSYETIAPELKIVSQLTLNDLSVDEVGLNNTFRLGLNDYQLYTYQFNSTDETKWFLVSPNDAVIVEEFNQNDQLTWYMAKGKYREAWSMSEPFISKLERLNIGIRQVNEYYKQGKWEETAAFLKLVLELDFEEENYESSYVERVIQEWNHWMAKFADSGNWDLIVDYIPSTILPNDNNKRISDKLYESYLVHYLSDSAFTEKFVQLMYKLDHMLFDFEEIYNLLETKLNDHDTRSGSNSPNELSGLDSSRIDSLRLLYIDLSLELDLPNNCVPHLITLKSDKIMTFLDEHHLISKNLKKIPDILLLAIGCTTQIKGIPIQQLKEKLETDIVILVENSHEILPKEFLTVLKERDLDVISFIYMEKLSKLDNLLAKDFEDDMISLYASYNKANLLAFLSRHNNYNIEKAIKVCEERGCTSELVYLLSKVGQHKNALILIIDKLDDPERAIEFAHSVNDKELWDFLLDYSMEKPEFVKALVATAGDSLDPIPIVSRIPNGVEIEGLKKSLIKVTNNVAMDKFIHELILKIIVNEETITSDNYRNMRSKGHVIEPNDHPKMQEETMIRFADESKALITEKDFLGAGKEWKGTVTTHGEKITHLSYIKRVLLSLQSHVAG